MNKIYTAPGCQRCAFVRRSMEKKGLQLGEDFLYIDVTQTDLVFEAGSELPVIEWYNGDVTYGLKVDDVNERIADYLASSVEAAA